MKDDDEEKDNKNEELKKALKEKLSGLTAKETETLRMRFGIDLEGDVTLEEIGNQFDETRKRIKEFEEKALKRLKNKENKLEAKCSFCGKTTSEVEKMIASEIERANICKECILESLKLIQE